MIYGKRSHGAVALLSGSQTAPDRRRWLAHSHGGDPGHLRRPRPRWRSTGSLNYARMLANTVVLPDGQVLIVGGGAAFKYTSPVKVARAVQPEHGDLDGDGAAAGRPDVPRDRTAAARRPGPVRRAGQRLTGPVRRDLLAAVPVPRGPPDHQRQPGHGRLEAVSCSSAAPTAASITRVVLIRPGSNTHEIDSDQRSVPLTFTTSGTTITAQVPSSANVVPPGYYMLFAVNSSGVPAVAPWVRVS